MVYLKAIKKITRMDVSVSGTIDQKSYLKKFTGGFSPLSPPPWVRLCGLLTHFNGCWGSLLKQIRPTCTLQLLLGPLCNQSSLLRGEWGSAGQWIKRDNQFVSDPQALAPPDIAYAKGCHVFFFHMKSRLKSTFDSEKMCGCLKLMHAL